MNTFRQAMLAACVILPASFAGNAATAKSFNMTVLGATNPPIGHYEFCHSHRSECNQVYRDRGPMTLTRPRWQDILDVNYEVNTRIRPMTDMEIWGKDEVWSYPTTVGDCEDYVLLKRKMLIKRGFKASDLLITVVLQPNGAGHAVLTVRTDRGDFVLDNMRDRVLLWSDTEYTFLKRQSSTNAARWTKIRDGRSSAVGSVSR